MSDFKINVSAEGNRVYDWEAPGTKPTVTVTFSEENGLFYFEGALTLKQAKELRNKLKSSIAYAKGE